MDEQEHIINMDVEQHQNDDGFIPIRIVRRGGMRENFWQYIERVTGQRSLRKFIWQGSVLTLLSGLPTIWATILRGQIYKKVLGSVGSSCFIEKNVRFQVPLRIFLGDRVFIGENSYLNPLNLGSEIRIEDDVQIARDCILKASLRSRNGKICVREGAVLNTRTFLYGENIEIGKNSLLGPGVHLITGTHIFKDTSVPIKFQDSEHKKIEIGDDVWLGALVVVLNGITIGKGSVVGAGSVVTKDIPEYSIAVGVPAKVIKKRI